MRARRNRWVLGTSLLLVGALGSGACRRRSTPNPSATGTPQPVSSVPALPARLELSVVDEAGASLPSRVHLRNGRDEIVNPKEWPSYHDHFVFDGKASLALPAGDYRYEIERGPEYRPERGKLSLKPPATTLAVKLQRITNLAAEDWYAGDLHIHRAPDEIELLLRAEDLSVGPVITWGNEPSVPVAGSRVRSFDGGRVADLSAGEDERYGGALLFFRLAAPLALPPSAREDGKIVQKPGVEGGEIPAAFEYAKLARREGTAHIEIEKPFWWDVPTWLALGLVDSVEIAHNHMNRSVGRSHEAWGRRCDRSHYGKTALANGYCTQDIYYRMLDVGLRLGPSAGSASGVLPNPVGYNRVYVHVAPPFSYEKWWEGLKRGESFVTNGPLLLVQANGNHPGHVFRANAGETVAIELVATAKSATPIRTVELIRDGKPTARGQYDSASGRVIFSPLAFKESGWFLVRAITDRNDTFRFASSAPFFVEIGPVPRRISRSAARFFETWERERIEQLENSGIDLTKLEPILEQHRATERYWSDMANRANTQ